MKNSFYKIALLASSILGLFIAYYIIYKVSPDNRVYYDLPTAFRNPLKVAQLNLREQKITELPKKITTLKNLKKLDLAINQLSIPSSSNISQLTKLEQLNLSHNNIEIISSTLSQLTQLKELHLAWNKLEELPEFITTLPLTHLDLSGNAFTAMPKSIQKLQKTLKVLNLSYNPITKTTLQELKTWLPNTEIISKDSVFVAKDYKEFYRTLNKENSLNDFYQVFAPLNIKEAKNWVSTEKFYKKLVTAQTITIIPSQIASYPSHILKRFNRLQELHLKGFITIERLEKFLTTFPNLEGISLEQNINIDTLLKHLSATPLKWIKLTIDVYENGNLEASIPDIFYTIPQAKILEITRFNTPYPLKHKPVLPKIKKSIDALFFNKIRWMPQNFADLPPIKSVFIQNTRNWQKLPKLKGLEFLDMSNNNDILMYDLVFLKKIAQLKELYLDYCDLKNMDQYLVPNIQNLKHLKILSIKGHKDKNLDKKAFQAALPNVKIIGL